MTIWAIETCDERTSPVSFAFTPHKTRELGSIACVPPVASKFQLHFLPSVFAGRACRWFPFSTLGRQDKPARAQKTSSIPKCARDTAGEPHLPRATSFRCPHTLRDILLTKGPWCCGSSMPATGSAGEFSSTAPPSASFLMEASLLQFIASHSHQPLPPCKVHIRSTPNQGRTLALAHDVRPGEVVLSVPPPALLNLKTIRDLFPPRLVPPPRPLWTPLPEPPALRGRECSSQSQSHGPIEAQAGFSTAGSDMDGIVPESRQKLDCGPLSHTALLSLFLCLVRQFPRPQLPARLHRFTTMVDSMPDSLFLSHPLWLYLYAHRLARSSYSPAEAAGAGEFYFKLWDAFPGKAKSLIQDVYSRFRQDWVSVCKAYVHIPTTNALRDVLFPEVPTPERRQKPLPLLTKEVFVWAWLCVNT